MAVTYGFFNSVNGDRKYNAEQMSEYFRGIINEGVYQHLDGGLAVTAGTGLAVNVAAGRAIIQNRWIQNSAAMSLTIAAASETYARKDAVVIRLNWSSRSISIAVKTGTPAASPVAPSMTRNSTTYEMALAYVNVAANATSVTVTDKRSDSTVCGWVTVAQSTSGEVDAMLNAMKTGFDGVTYASPAAMVTSCDNLKQDMYPLDFGSSVTSVSTESRPLYHPGWIKYIKIYNATPGATYFIANSFYNHVTDHTRVLQIYQAKADGTAHHSVLYISAVNTDPSNVDAVDVVTNYRNSEGSEIVDIVVDWSKCRSNSYTAKIALSGDALSYNTKNDNDDYISFSKSIMFDGKDVGDYYRYIADPYYSSGYNTSTRYPIWTKNLSYRRVIISNICDKGTIKLSKTAADVTPVIQLYLLDAEGKHIWNYRIKNDTTISEYGITTDDNYVYLNMSAVYAYGARQIAFSYNINSNPNFEVILDHAIYPAWMASTAESEDQLTDIIIPSKLRVCAGVEMNVYYPNVIRYYNTEKAPLIKFSNNNMAYNTYFSRFTPAESASSGNFTTAIQLYKDNTYGASKTSSDITVYTIPKNAGNGLSKKVLFIGDSMTDAGVYAATVKDMFESDVMSITLLGTRDTSTGANEGYSGWRAYTFVNCPDWNTDVATWGGTPYPPESNPSNPFYNSSEETFDFSMYMTNQGYTGVDYVFINLGTNDIARGNHQTDSDIISYYNTMINSIKAYNANAKIVLWLPPCRALYQNTNRQNIDSSLRMNKLLIATYDNRENENIFLCPVYFNIDPHHDYNSSSQNISSRNSNYQVQICSDSVHPATAGYNKIADVIYSMIKYLGSIDS